MLDKFWWSGSQYCPLFSPVTEWTRWWVSKKVQSALMHWIIDWVKNSNYAISDIMWLVASRELLIKLELYKVKHLVQFIISQCKNQEDIDRVVDYFEEKYFQDITISSSNRELILNSQYNYGWRVIPVIAIDNSDVQWVGRSNVTQSRTDPVRPHDISPELWWRLQSWDLKWNLWGLQKPNKLSWARWFWKK